MSGQEDKQMEEQSPDNEINLVEDEAKSATEKDSANFETAKNIAQEFVDPNIGTIKPREIVSEMQESYLDYAMSIIVARALPDVRDGLKPVHRRVLYSMNTLGLRSNVKYRKSATIVGEVMGNYHPHGDMAIYDTLVRMAQDFSMRYLLVDGQGNFGSMDGDSAAAMRYTEARMNKISEEILSDIEKDTVDWQDNYDGTKKEPAILPSRIPQLLLNGSMGIAVGMATNIPPHNLSEVCDAIIYQIDNPEADIDELMKFIKGPDFPTAGIIYDIDEIKQAYATGKGKVIIRGKAEIEEQKRGFRIIVSEIPYQVNKATLISKIADLVHDKKLDGIYDIRDESDRNGVRVVIEIKANAYPNKILNRLYELTQLQTAFHVNMLALTPSLEPQLMNLKTIISYFIEHRQEIITRRSRYELKKAKDRAHILEGLKIALDNIEAVIETIKKSTTKETAHKNLKSRFGLSDLQAAAILEMRLSALAGLERQKVEDEYQEKLKLIAYLEDLLKSPAKILALVKNETEEIKEKYGDQRRTKVVPQAIGRFTAEDLIPDEQVIVTLTAGGYIKRLPVDTYRSQVRGGKGVTGMTTKEEDAVEHLINVSTHDDVMFFTNQGRLFRTKVYEIPASGRQAKGVALVNIIQLAPNEKVTALLVENSKSLNDDQFFFMATKGGVVKKTAISAYKNVRKTGIIAIKLNKGDELRWVKVTNGNDIIVEVSSKGQAICYPESDVRPMGRGAAGVRGINLRPSDSVMAVDVVDSSRSPFGESVPKFGFPDMLVVLENGFGKRTMLKHFNLQKRGGVGIKAANCTPKTGSLVGMHIIHDDLGDVILVSRNGQIIRMKLSTIKRLGRDTQGVTLMRLSNDRVSSVTIIRPDNEDEAEDNPSDQGGNNQTNSKKPNESAKNIKTNKKPAEETSVKSVKGPIVKTGSKKIESKKKIDSHTAPITRSNKPAPTDKTVSKKPIIINAYKDKNPLPQEAKKPLIQKEQPLFKVNKYKPEVKTEIIEKSEPMPKKLFEEPNYWGKQ